MTMRKREKLLEAVLIVVDIACVAYALYKSKRKERDNA